MIFAFGSLIDWEIWSALMPLSASSRFGPMVPVVPACARVWQPPQLVAKNCGGAKTGGLMPGTPATLAT